MSKYVIYLSLFKKKRCTETNIMNKKSTFMISLMKATKTEFHKY